MALSAGQRLGVYEVIGPLGAGGMGEVYRARDTRLGRDVALKILPEVFASDPERLARFEREAQVLASLNHPHIAAIHGLEENGGVRALVMELVDGDTLAERIAGQPMPLDEALGIARQIADALEGAHEQGIIHRDLKPANIKVTPAGKVKVLDFGLAKLHDPNASNVSNVPNATMSPTMVSPAMTTVGVLIGTAAYMAPEQARGRATDRRVDVWAFGCVLFETLSGQHAFPGSDVTEVLATVLKSEPEWSALPSSTPPRVRRVLERCLQKDPKQRLHDIGDVRLALDGAFESPAAPVPAAAASSAGRRMIWPAATVVLTLAAAAFTWFLGRSTPADPITRRFSIVLPAGDRLPPASGTMVAVSPDGQMLMYRAARDVMRMFVRRIDQFDAAMIGEGSPGEAPFFSDDGQWIAYFLNNMLKKVPVSGGPSETIATVTDPARGGDWRGDTIVLAGSTLSTVPAAGGMQTTLATAPSGRRYWYPQFVADGRAIIYTSSGPRPDGGDLEVFDVATKTSRRLLQGAAARLLPTGHLVFVRSGSLWAVKFDEASLQVEGTPVPVVEGIRVENGGAVQYSVSRDGTLMYIPGSATTETELVWIDRTGKEESLGPVPRRAYFSVRVDPTGKRLALDIRDQGADGADIWVLQLGRQTPTRVTFDAAEDTFPAWTPDGRLVFTSTRDKSAALYVQEANGTGGARKIAGEASGGLDQSSVTPDGKSVVARGGEDIVLVDLAGTGSVRKLVEGPFRERNPEVSPDGRWLAYQSDESGAFEVYVRPFPDVAKGKWQASEQGGSRPVWARNGKELFYVGSDQSLMSVAYTGTAGAFDSSPPKKLFGFTQLVGGAARTFDVSDDGQRFIAMKTGIDSDRSELRVVVNWFEELKKKVATK